MAGNRDEILKDLRNYVIEVHFDKVNGDHRVMRCTLRPDLLPPSYRGTKRRNRISSDKS